MKRNRTSLQRKLLIMNISVILCMVLSIGLFSYYETSRTIRQDVERFSNLVLKQGNLNLNRYFNEYEQALSLIGLSRDYQEWINASQGNRIQMYLAYTQLEEKNFTPFNRLHPEIVSITLYNRNGNEMSYALKGMDKDYTVTSEPWFQTLPESGKTQIYLVQSHHILTSDGKPTYMPLLSFVKNFTTYNGQNGFIKMDVSLEPINRILNEMELAENGIGFIVDKNGIIVAHPNTEQIGHAADADLMREVQQKENGFFSRKRTNELVMFQTVPFTGWKSVVEVPFGEVSQSIVRVRNMTFSISIIGIMAASILIVTLISKYMAGIRNIRQVIKQTELGKMEPRATIIGHDEVGDLGRAYNSMLDNLQSVIHQLSESKVKQKEAAYHALQSQINSHFLYNTLESINSLANMIDHQPIQTMTVGLSRMLRYSAALHDRNVTIGDEIRHVIHFMNIIKIRYEEKFQYEIEDLEGCSEIPCIVAVFQPIVENSIKHGLEKTGLPLFVHIRLIRESTEYMAVHFQDNGPGFTQDELDRLSQQLHDPDFLVKYNHLKHIGLLNVHYRIRMMFPDSEAGVFLANAEGGRGALVTLRFPCQPVKGAD
ncbi:cache domain-containing sensor histidine kinase [Paenibacillus roseipurpureus]|uniref:Cache domain-containing protein n=1 Tax=Paenibacillus roseopurpureus TaxID=2918901 RepID=A0AA96LRA0_9BACL|nr:cache domain-containing protein [Paenibacillus sp. MBLB1832]WNR45764.1 cache domain-containing protein [Paenibacillus sp. MBLB1832]